MKKISSPVLTKNGLWFDDESNTRHLIDAVSLYSQLSDPRREMLVVQKQP
jgi:hypothetical protein